jgi:hypothetical protein
MTDRTTLLALAERVEKADRPLEILDCDIWDIVRGAVTPWGEKHTGPAYISSLDAAARLVPANAMRRSGDSAMGLFGTFFCDIVTENGRDFHALANNEPCAIVAAALRARAEAWDE